MGLGLIPAGARAVFPIPSAIKSLVPKPVDNNITVKPTVPDVERDTMPLIINKINRTAWQVAKLAPKLKGATVDETLRNVSQFQLNHIKYVKDDPAHEQVRSPRRVIHDAKGDCDCMTVLTGALLKNLGIPFRLRIAQYGNSANQWSHIYVVVPRGNTYTTLDPVTNRHNYEVPFTLKKDYTMALQSLDGVGECPPKSEVLNRIKPLNYVSVKALRNQKLTELRKGNLVQVQAPAGLKGAEEPEGNNDAKFVLGLILVGTVFTVWAMSSEPAKPHKNLSGAIHRKKLAYGQL
jgi:hypothetical protein